MEALKKKFSTILDVNWLGASFATHVDWLRFELFSTPSGDSEERTKAGEENAVAVANR